MPSELVPNEDGILVPVEAPELELSENERALCLAAQSGGSGEGMSHYSQASRCGRRARLSSARYDSFAKNRAALPATKNHFVIGSVYHKLHEWARDPGEVALNFDENFQNPNVAEAARLYRGWVRHWGLDFWGECLGTEVRLEDKTSFTLRDWENTNDNSGVALYREVLKETPINVTGALDMVVEMDEAACERAKKRGLDIEPGRRLIDWKTSDLPSDGSGYRNGLQALWYPHLWNLHHPRTPVDGIIFDVVNKRSRRKDRSVLSDDFQAYYVPVGLEGIDTLQGMVLQGHRNVVDDIPNRSECVSWRGDVCPFRLNGECDARMGVR